MTKSSTPKVAARKARDVAKAASQVRTGKTDNTQPKSAVAAAAERPKDKGRKTAAPKIAVDQLHNSHRKSAPKAVAENARDTHHEAAPKIVAEKTRDTDRKAARQIAEQLRASHRKTAPKAVAENTRDTHHEAAPKIVAEKTRDTDRKAAREIAEQLRASHRKTAPKIVPEHPKAVADKTRDAHRRASPNIATEQLRDTRPMAAAQSEELRDAQVPGSMRELVERNVAQTRELYERSKDALQSALEIWGKSFGAAGQGAVTVNRKIMDIADRNINSSFDLAESLAGARNLPEALELQAAYWRKLFGELQTQAEEVRALSTKVSADVVKPIKDA
jgi:hypothetical protein